MFGMKEQLKLIACTAGVWICFNIFEKWLRHGNNWLKTLGTAFDKDADRSWLGSRGGDYFGKHCSSTSFDISAVPRQATPFQSAFSLPVLSPKIKQEQKEVKRISQRHRAGILAIPTWSQWWATQDMDTSLPLPNQSHRCSPGWGALLQMNSAVAQAQSWWITGSWAGTGDRFAVSWEGRQTQL